MSTTTRSRLYVLTLAAGCFTSGVNVGVLSPLIKLIGRDLGVSDAAVGQGAALHALIAGITALVVAPWVDRFHAERCCAPSASSSWWPPPSLPSHLV